MALLNGVAPQVMQLLSQLMSGLPVGQLPGIGQLLGGSAAAANGARGPLDALLGTVKNLPTSLRGVPSTVTDGLAGLGASLSPTQLGALQSLLAVLGADGSHTLAGILATVPSADLSAIAALLSGLSPAQLMRLAPILAALPAPVATALSTLLADLSPRSWRVSVRWSGRTDTRSGGPPAVSRQREGGSGGGGSTELTSEASPVISSTGARRGRWGHQPERAHRGLAGACRWRRSPLSPWSQERIRDRSITTSRTSLAVMALKNLVHDCAVYTSRSPSMATRMGFTAGIRIAIRRRRNRLRGDDYHRYQRVPSPWRMPKPSSQPMKTTAAMNQKMCDANPRPPSSRARMRTTRMTPMDLRFLCCADAGGCTRSHSV